MNERPYTDADRTHAQHLACISFLFTVLYFAAMTVFGILAARYHSDALNTFAYSLFYSLNTFLSPLLLFFCYGLLGYSVLRYGASKAKGVITALLLIPLFTVLADFICFVSVSTFETAFDFYFLQTPLLPIVNFITLEVETVILIAFCSIYRAFHTNKSTMQVGLTKKTLFQKKNALTKIYFFYSLFCLVFALIPALADAIHSYRLLGFFQNTTEFFTFIEPFIVILYCFIAGYFVMAVAGILETKKSHKLRGRK